MEKFTRRRLFEVVAKPMVGMVVSSGIIMVALSDMSQNVEPAIREVKREIGMPSETELNLARGLASNAAKHSREEVSKAIELQFKAEDLIPMQRQLLMERGICERKRKNGIALALGLGACIVSVFRAGP